MCWAHQSEFEERFWSSCLLWEISKLCQGEALAPASQKNQVGPWAHQGCWDPFYMELKCVQVLKPASSAVIREYAEGPKGVTLQPAGLWPQSSIPHLYNENNKGIYGIELLWGLNDYIHLSGQEQCPAHIKLSVSASCYCGSSCCHYQAEDSSVTVVHHCHHIHPFSPCHLLCFIFIYFTTTFALHLIFFPNSQKPFKN